VILSSVVSSQYTRVTDKQQPQTDSQHAMAIAELTMQLQLLSKNRSLVNNHSTLYETTSNKLILVKRTTMKVEALC